MLPVALIAVFVRVDEGLSAAEEVPEAQTEPERELVGDADRERVLHAVADGVFDASADADMDADVVDEPVRLDDSDCVRVCAALRDADGVVDPDSVPRLDAVAFGEPDAVAVPLAERETFADTVSDSVCVAERAAEGENDDEPVSDGDAESERVPVAFVEPVGEMLAEPDCVRLAASERDADGEPVRTGVAVDVAESVSVAHDVADGVELPLAESVRDVAPVAEGEPDCDGE